MAGASGKAAAHGVSGRVGVRFAKAAALGIAIFLLAWLSITLTSGSGRLAAIWPCNAVAVVCLLRTHPRRWPALLACAFLGNLAADLVCGEGVVVSVGLSLGNALEIFVCSAGLRRFAGRHFDIRRRAHVWRFAAVCGLVGPLLGAGVAALVIGGSRLGISTVAGWANWVLGDALGMLVLVPPLFLLAQHRRTGSSLVRRPQPADAVPLAVLTATVTFVFAESRVPLLFVVPPLLVLVTFQMEVLGAVLGLLITAVISAVLLSLGYGPETLLGPDLLRQMTALQVFLLVCAVTALPVGTTLAERRRVKASLDASEAQLRLLSDNGTDLVVLLDDRAVVEYVSPSVARFGYAPGEVIGRRTLDFVHPDDLERATQIHRALFTGDPVDPTVRREYRSITKSGDIVWMEGNPTIIRDEAGKPVKVVTSYRDVTIRRRLEDELIEAKAKAEAASEAKSEFLANMSHEIRTPLTGVVGFAELLGDIRDLPPEADLCVRRIISAGQSLLAVVNDVLDFSKLEAGQLALDPHPFSPADFTRDVVDLVADQAREKGLRLELQLDPALPAHVLADSARLRQVLMNLLGNALKFTAEGEVRVTARHFAGPAPRLRFEVADTGPGVPADRLDRLFQRFSQVDGSISRHYGGSGLGLAICRKLTDLMGGRIGVESEAGVGSTFWFEVAAPLADAPAAPRAAAPEQIDEDRPATILVVDDVAVNRELVRAMLTPLGHHCLEASSGPEAVAMASQPGLDLILMDLQMPGMDGLTATRAIRASGPAGAAIPILALSANVLSQHVAACEEAGMDDHICKPIRAAELVTKVHRWLAVGRASLPHAGHIARKSA